MSNILTILLTYLAVILILILPVIWIVNISHYMKLLSFIRKDKSTKDYLLAADLEGLNRLIGIYNRTKYWFLYEEDEINKSIYNHKKVFRESLKITSILIISIFFISIILFIVAYISM